MKPADIKILVTDDDPDIRGGTARVLAQAGYLVTQAATGEAALRAVQTEVPDLLLLDRDLPGIDGLEVCRRVKADPAAVDCLVVLASGSYVESENQAEGLEAGADGYIIRPIANRELLARVGAYARLIQLRSELRRKTEELTASAEAAAAAQLASLNLAEDALAAREQLEILNRELRQEIAERRRAEAELQRQSQLRAALLELPVAAEQLDEKAFMQRGQELAEDLTGSVISFIHFVHPDQETIELVTWSRRTLEKYCHAAYDNHYPVKQAGIWADALRERRPVIFNDYPGYPHKHGLPQGHSELARLISVPVIEHGRVVMLAGVGNKPSDYTEHDVKVVQLIGESIWRIVQRRRSEAQLHKLSLAVEQSPATIVITDPAGAIEYVNPRFTAATGYTLDEVRGKNPRVIKSGQTAPEIFADLWNTISAGREWRGEIVNRKKSGELFTDFVIITPVKDTAGRITHFLSIKEDITERRRVRLALEASEAKFRRLLTMVPLPLGHSDGRGHITFVNESFHRVFGYTLAEVPTLRAWWARAYPDPVYSATLAEKWSHALAQAAVNGGQIPSIECAITCRDGQVRTVELSGIVLGEETLVVFVDITARIQADLEIRKLSRIIEQAPVSVAITNLAGALEYINPTFLAISGYTREEVLGKNPRVLKSGLTPPAVYADMWQTLLRGEVWRGELSNKKKNGEIYHERAVIAPVSDDTDTVTHYVALKEDITEQKRTEAALRENDQRYRELFDLESDAILLLEAESGRIIRANQAASVMYGATTAELETLRNVDLSAEPESTLATARAPAAAAGGVLHVPHRLHRRRDGTVFPVEITLRFFERDGRWFYLSAVRDITARQQAEAELRESRDRLAQAEKIAHLGNWVLDFSTQQMTWSDEMFRLLELDPATARPSLEVWHRLVAPDEQGSLQRRLTESLASPRRFVLGNRLLFADGRTKYVATTGETVFAADGTPLRTIGTLQDITDRKLVEIELHELVKGLRALHQISRALEQRDLTSVQLMELVVSELPGAMCYPEDTRVTIAIGPDERSAGAAGALVDQLSVPIQINDHPAGHLTVGYVRPHPTASQGPFFVREQEVLENIARTIGLGLGKRESFEAVQRFNAELESMVAFRTNELDARNREVQALLESIPDMVMRLRRDGSVLDFRPAKGATPLADPHYAAEFGHPSEATSGLRNAVFTTGARALAEDTTVATEAELPLPAGTVAIELRAAPIGGEEFVVFVRDITERKRLEAEAAAMLEKERQVSEMKTRFISVTSHEFRTPMAAAMGSIELLRHHLDRMSPAKREELFVRIDTSMHRMTQMLDEILTLSRIDAGRVRPVLGPLDLPALVRNVVEEIRMGDRDGHEFSFSTEGDASPFPSDPNLLHHILSNLLSNAARYSPPASRVAVHLAADDRGITLTVDDQGIGIPEADRERIFAPFERGSNVGNIKGTGLGLNIVRRMTEMLGGTIHAEPGAERGSRFTLRLPRDPAGPS